MKRLRRSLALALLGAILCGCDSDHAKEGQKLFELNDYSGAIEELDWALKANPDDMAARYTRARAHANTSRRKNAKAGFAECRKDPAFRKGASRNLVMLLLLDKEFDAADKVIAEDLEKFGPSDPDTLELRGIAALRRTGADLAALGKQLIDVVGENPSAWAIERMVKSRTLPEEAFKAWTRDTVEDLTTRRGLRDPSVITGAAAKTRAAALAAKADFTVAAGANPAAFRSLAELGQLAIDAWDSEAARAAYTRILELDESRIPDQESRSAYTEARKQAVSILSEHFEAIGRLPDAVAVLAAEMQRGSLVPGAQERLGRLYLATKQFDQADKVATALIERESRSTWGSYLKGAVAANKGSDEEAITWFSRALVRSPSDWTINAALGRVLAKLGRYTLAEDALRNALTNGGQNDLELTLEYADVLANETDAIRAAQYLETRLKASFPDPASAPHQRLLAQIRAYFAASGIRPQNLVGARTALALNPQNAFLKLTVARFEHDKGLSAMALGRCREVVNEFPGLADGWVLQGQILVDIGKGHEALPALERAAALRPDDPNIPWTQGRVALQEGRPEEARKYLARAIEIDPKLGGPRLDLLDAELRADNPTAALTQAQALLERFPEDPRVHRGIGLAKLAMKDPQGAIAPLRKATESRPADPAIRIKLATALRDTGAIAEARTVLVDLAGDTTLSLAARKTATEALDSGGFYQEAAAAWVALFSTATTEAERLVFSAAAFRSHLAAGKLRAALDDLVQMTLSGRKDHADRTFLVAAENAGFHREAAAQASILRANDALDAVSLEAAWKAHVATKEWLRAIEDMDDLMRLRPELAGSLRLERASALIAVGKLPEAERAAEQPASRETIDPARAIRLKLELAIAGGDPAAIEAALSLAIAAAPEDPKPRLAAARAFATAGQLDKAVAVIASSPPRMPDEDGALLAAGILVAGNNLTGAGSLLGANLDHGPRVVEAHGLVSVLLGNAPPAAAKLAAVLDRMAQRDPAAARAAIAKLDLPVSIATEIWATLEGLAASHPERALVLAQELARARLLLESRVLADRAFSTLRNLGDAAGDRRLPLDLLRAWWKIEIGEAKAAADIVVPMMEKQGDNPAVLLIASVAGLTLAGPDAPTRLLGMPGPLSDAFLRDLGRVLAARGNHVVAIKALAKLSQPDDRDKALMFLLYVERRDLKDAEAALRALPAEWLKKPAFVAARIWVLANDEKSRPEAVAAIKALVALPHELERMDALTLYEAAVLAGAGPEAAQILESALEKSAFSPEPVSRFLEILRRTGTEKTEMHRLEDHLGVLDPSGRLRQALPRPVTID